MKEKYTVQLGLDFGLRIISLLGINETVRLSRVRQNEATANIYHG